MRKVLNAKAIDAFKPQAKPIRKSPEILISKNLFSPKKLTGSHA